MKIALAQLNYHVANFKSNTQKIKEHILSAKEAGADLVVFSELSVTGYPPRDFLEHRDFILAAQESIEEIAALCTDIAAVVGAPMINHNPKGKMLYNSAYFLAYGKIHEVRHKTLLPTYDVFDEYRYFEPNSEFEVVYYKGKRIALTICEDLWDNQPVENQFSRSKLYRNSPMRELMKHEPDFVINIAASPFSYSQENTREAVLRENAINYGLPIFYVNQVGAHTELIFDGDSMYINADGELVDSLGVFKENMKVFDLENPVPNKELKHGTSDYIERIHDALVMGVRDFFGKLGMPSAVLGLSGGIDSAVVLAILERALGPENVRVILMPSKFSSDHSVTDAEQMAQKLGVKYDLIAIQDGVDRIESALSPIFGDLPRDVTEENIQARLRGIYVMALSNKYGNMPVNTSNKSETAVGYGTLYGDMNGALSVIGDVYKQDVYKLARFINKDDEIIPENIITKPPSAELSPDQKDTDSLPDYAILDDILYRYIERKQSENEIVEAKHDRETVRRVMKLVNRNEFKRYQTPPILRVSTKAFGMGRRMPIVANFNYERE